MKVTWRNVTLGALLGVQVVGIAAARFGPERYFCWAPYDEITRFEIVVTIDGRQLSPAEIQARYRLPEPARDNRSHANVILPGLRTSSDRFAALSRREENLSVVWPVKK